MAFVSWHLTVLRLVFNEFTASPSSKVLVRVFDNSAALQMLRDLCKSRSGILISSSRSCRSWIPQMIRSLTSESLRSPKLQVAPNSFKSVTNFSCDSPGSWVREKNLNPTTVSFFLDYNARRTLLTPTLRFFPRREFRRPSNHKFLFLDCRLNTEITLLSLLRLCRSLPDPCTILILASIFSNCQPSLSHRSLTEREV